jgi:4-aminobutyrate aminotransferase/(S)-3-amino-2-methylpropionate transaminase
VTEPYRLAELRRPANPHPLGEPGIRRAPPGPRSRGLAGLLAAAEAPGISGFAAGAPPIVWEAACGSRVRDVDGNVYVDLTAGFGVMGVGHAHPRVVAAVCEQAPRLAHGMGDVFPHATRVALAQRLAALAPFAEARVYLATSGSEAVEIALKTARLLTGRPGVAAFEGGYHGLTYGALRATWRPEFRAPFEEALAPPTLRLPFPNPFRPPFDTAPDRLAAACLETSRRLLQAAAARAELPGALVTEPVQGREGIVVPPQGWLAGLGELCRELGILLVVDEVLTGFGRTGARFAVEREGVTPDILVVGKALGGGLPIGAAIAPAAVFEAWRRDGEALHTSTFLGHPLACAAALAALDVLEGERLSQRAAAWESRLGEELGLLAGLHPVVGDVRGLGMMWGVELVWPGRPADANPAAARQVAAGCLRRGVLVITGGYLENVLQITPPLVLEEREWAFALAAMSNALGEMR